ncbi:hypothetical protein BRADI_3g54259v3 [Brachypodium distachyon]|uniref:Uncharacterized protein n=1 Tax=Brachypodium distachyon TaxID=15368 RepID=A0A0Q3JRT6_BRADI|nr:hypothetical protein BRADI_3g54259v3 [Brachypodium distachyon]
MHRRRATTILTLVVVTFLLVIMDSGEVSARRLLPSPPRPALLLLSGDAGGRSRLMHERRSWDWEPQIIGEKAAAVGSLTAMTRRLLGQRKPGSPPSPKPHGMTTMFRPLPPPPPPVTE